MMCPTFLFMNCNLWLHELMLAHHDFSQNCFAIQCSMIWIALLCATAQFMAKPIHDNEVVKSCPSGQFIAVAISLFRSSLCCSSDRNSHTNHGVVTCADQANHLYASGRWEYPWTIQKPYNINISHRKIFIRWTHRFQLCWMHYIVFWGFCKRLLGKFIRDFFANYLIHIFEMASICNNLIL